MARSPTLGLMQDRNVILIVKKCIRSIIGTSQEDEELQVELHIEGPCFPSGWYR